jgi:hypothetical protein
MSTARVTASLDARQPAASRMAPATLAVAFICFVVFVAISRYLLVAPDTVVTLRNNVIFETDSGVRLRYLTNPSEWAVTRLELVEHPALFLVWKPLGLLLTTLFGLVLSSGRAAVLAAQTLVCAAAAVGAASLHSIARRHAGPALAIVPVVLFVFATSTVLLVVPEQWAFSTGLMLLTLSLLTRPGPFSRGRLVTIALLCALIASTTITNIVFAVVFGAVAGVPLLRRSGIRLPDRKWLAIIGTACAVVAIVAAALLIRLPQVAGFLNMRLVEQPVRALEYMAFGLVGPIVGPAPHRNIIREHIALSYEPVSFAMYQPIQWIGVVAWAVLLGMCVVAALRGRETRSIGVLLLAWVGWNLVFHNLWGDEFFLYSPHWAWALTTLVALGLRRIPVRVALTLGAAVLLAQVASLFIIGNVLRS